MSRGGSDSGYHFLQEFRNCEVYWYNKNRLGLQPKWEAPYNLYGTSMHRALEERYLAMQEGDPDHIAIKRADNEFESAMTDVMPEYREVTTFAHDLEKGKSVLPLYGLHYSRDSKDFKVLHLEQTLELELTNGFWLTGDLDMVVDCPGLGGIHIMDHKNTGWSLANIKRTLSVSGQATCYLALWNHKHPDKKTFIIRFNIIRFYNGTINFDRQIIMKTQSDIDRFLDEAALTFEQINDKVVDPNAVVLHNFDSCFRFNRACEYLELCQGENFKSLLGVKFVRKLPDGTIVAPLEAINGDQDG